MASIIDLTLAKSLIHEFKTQNTSSNGPALLTPDGQHLNGFFIDRHSVETMLSHEGCVGLSLNFAKHPDAVGSDQNIYTIIFTGVEHNAGGNSGTPYKRVGHTVDLLNPCPPYCTDLG